MTGRDYEADYDAEWDDGLRPALESLRRRWLTALATASIVIAVGGYVVMGLSVSYQAGAVVSFIPRIGGQASGDIAPLLVARYPEVIASVTAVDQAADEAGVEPSQVRAGLSAGIQPETLNLVFSTTLATPEEAMSATTSLLESIQQENLTDPNLRVVIVSNPNDWGPTGVSKKLLGAAVVLAAVTLGFTAALIVDGLRSP